MIPAKRWPIALGIAGVFVLISIAHTDRDALSAQTRKRVFVTRLYTGPDNQTHTEDIETAFTAAPIGAGSDVSQLLKITGRQEDSAGARAYRAC